MCYSAAHLARHLYGRLITEALMERRAGNVLVLTVVILLGVPAPALAKTEIQW